MENQTMQNFSDSIDKDKKLKELEEKLGEMEKKLNELNRELEQKKIESTVEINRLLKNKARFIDNLSHDLATPITPLISLLPMIKEDVKSEDSKQLIDTCLRNVEYLKRVINNARELADISSTDLILKQENLLEIVNNLEKKYEVVFKSYNVNVNNNITEDVFIKTEKNRLLQLLDHITSNAIYSMPDGGDLTFNFKLVKKEDKQFVQVSISDTGIGMTRDQTDRAFDEFYKTDDARHKLDSTGLGLTICKEIIEKHGGKIWADSHGKGTGTTIYFTIPSKDSVFTRSF
jgi:signal transduction histidine kinase